MSNILNFWAIPLVALILIYLDLKKLRSKGANVNPYLYIFLYAVLTSFAYIFNLNQWLFMPPMAVTIAVVVMHLVIRSFKLKNIQAQANPNPIPSWHKYLLFIGIPIAVIIFFLIFAYILSRHGW